jgi:hypothetical protein
MQIYWQFSEQEYFRTSFKGTNLLKNKDVKLKIICNFAPKMVKDEIFRMV